MAHLWWYSDPLTPHQSKEEKNVVKVGSPLTTLSGSAHASFRFQLFRVHFETQLPNKDHLDTPGTKYIGGI